MRSTRAVRALVAIALAASALLPGAGTGHAVDAQPILGSGSTFAALALQQWATDVKSLQGLTVEFKDIGSKAGLNQFQQGTVDFASSDVPYAPTDPVPRTFAYVPIVAGGTALLYKIHGTSGRQITNLRLSPRTVAGIFFGTITSWADPQIKADNRGIEQDLPDEEIRLAVRKPGSGTTGVFTDFLSTVAPDLWQDFLGRSQAFALAGGNYIIDWPASTGQFDCHCVQYDGSAQIAEAVARNTPGAEGTIGYAETAYADQAGVPVALIKNQAGFYRAPSARNVAVALLEATQNADGTENLEQVHLSTREEAYPASSYNYLVLPTDGSISPEKGKTLGAYIVYSVTQGQAAANDEVGNLKYSPLPPNLVQYAFDKVPLIAGADPPPELGDWGRFYEQLDVDTPERVEETPVGGGVGGDPTQQAPGGGDEAGGGQGGGDDGSGGGGGGGGGSGGGSGGGGGGGGGGATTTTVAQAGGSTTTVPGRGTPTDGGPATSIAADGSTVYLDDVGGPTRGNEVAMSRGLAFDDAGNLISKDGEAVPEVKTIGIGLLLAIAAVLVGLILLPPLVIGGIVRRRRLAAPAVGAAPPPPPPPGEPPPPLDPLPPPPSPDPLAP